MAGFMPYRDGVATGSYRLPWASWAPASNGATLAECPESRKKSVHERADRRRHRTFSFTAAGASSAHSAAAAARGWAVGGGGEGQGSARGRGRWGRGARQKEKHRPDSNRDADHNRDEVIHHDGGEGPKEYYPLLSICGHHS